MDKYYDLDSNEVMPEVSFDEKYPYKTMRLDTVEVALKWLYENRRAAFGAMMSRGVWDAEPETTRTRAPKETKS
jgi:hypothetical protein